MLKGRGLEVSGKTVNLDGAFDPFHNYTLFFIIIIQNNQRFFVMFFYVVFRQNINKKTHKKNHLRKKHKQESIAII